ncbi:hypothetical protein NXX20_00495 [Bacteroides stercoris]|nr:hypothetical protein [Bacteroides stercoris]
MRTGHGKTAYIRHTVIALRTQQLLHTDNVSAQQEAFVVWSLLAFHMFQARSGG